MKTNYSVGCSSSDYSTSTARNADLGNCVFCGYPTVSTVKLSENRFPPVCGECLDSLKKTLAPIVDRNCAVYDVIARSTRTQTHSVVAPSFAAAEKLFLEKYPHTEIEEIRLHSSYVQVQSQNAQE